MPTDICVIKPSLGCGGKEVVINSWRHIVVSINGTANKLHFERVKPFAIADRCQRAGMHGLAGDVRRNLRLLRGRCLAHACYRYENNSYVPAHERFRATVSAASSNASRLRLEHAGLPHLRRVFRLRA
jgi:hypothetical protein